jgi:subtilase family serine protease
MSSSLASECVVRARGFSARGLLWHSAVLLGLVLIAVPSLARAQVPLAGGHAAEAAEMAGESEIAPDQTLRISIRMALRNRAELEKLIAQQQDPSSPLYHRWLTPDEFNDRFGPTADDLAMVEGWLTKSGFSVESASMSRHTVVASAGASVAEKTFAVKIAATPDGKIFANLSDPIVPASIAPLIASIHGLGNTMRVKQELSRRPAEQAQPQATIGGRTAFGPRDLWTFYDETGLNGSGTTGAGADCIALVESSDFEDTSLAAFDATFALLPAIVTRVLADGGNPGTAPGDALTEANLDVQYAHAMAPGAPISVYLGEDSPPGSGSGLVDGLARAVNDNACGAISLSFAFCGVSSSFYTGTLDPMLMQAAAQGQAVFVSAGDQGAAGLRATAQGCVPARTRTVSELAADPNVIAVGGTQFTPNFDGSGDVTGYSSEAVWHDKAPVPKMPTRCGRWRSQHDFRQALISVGSVPQEQETEHPGHLDGGIGGGARVLLRRRRRGHLLYRRNQHRSADMGGHQRAGRAGRGAYSNRRYQSEALLPGSIG